MKEEGLKTGKGEPSNRGKWWGQENGGHWMFLFLHVVEVLKGGYHWPHAFSSPPASPPHISFTFPTLLIGPSIPIFSLSLSSQTYCLCSRGVSLQRSNQWIPATIKPNMTPPFHRTSTPKKKTAESTVDGSPWFTS